TDDNQLMEQLGVAVKLVDCGKENIKITHPEDIHFAELLLAVREMTQ
ncbi:MAG: 2-C-methyl-D-erythritol 4-phosphate cytidylyltransferase, partial [Clostridia bacterium]|nr:2-C-methyl-D-erythritol 4-phosphate cytidylyltransferase [Clostridia bacterium]